MATKSTEAYLLSKVEAGIQQFDLMSKKMKEEIENYQLEVLEKQKELNELNETIASNKRAEQLRKDDAERIQKVNSEIAVRNAEKEIAQMRREGAENLLSQYNLTAIDDDRVAYLETLESTFKDELKQQVDKQVAIIKNSLESKYALNQTEGVAQMKLQIAEYQAEVKSLTSLLESARQERDRAFEELRSERTASVERTKGATPVINLSDSKK